MTLEKELRHRDATVRRSSVFHWWDWPIYLALTMLVAGTAVFRGGPDAYAGTADFLHLLVEAADAAGIENPFRRAALSGAAAPKSLRDKLGARGIDLQEVDRLGGVADRALQGDVARAGGTELAGRRLDRLDVDAAPAAVVERAGDGGAVRVPSAEKFWA